MPLWLRIISVAAVSLILQQGAQAVVIATGDGTGNTNAPSGNMGWSYVGAVNGASGVYLGGSGGEGWVLTAGHVGLGDFTVDGAIYSAVTGSGHQIGSIDLYAYKITVGVGTGLSLLSNLSLASASPVSGTTLTMIGNGRDRAPGVTTWYIDTTQSSWTWSTSSFSGANATDQGFLLQGTSSKRWGTNLSDGMTHINSTSMIQTTFLGGVHNAQAVLGDSGGGVLTAVGSGYQLSGIIDLMGSLNNQPGFTAVAYDTSYAIDIAPYRQEIISLTGIPEPSTYALAALGGAFLILGCRPWALRMMKPQATRESR